jgi:pentose-5-phosphate-3-epimerase
MMSHLSPSIVCYSGTFKETAALLNVLGCKRAHIDVTAGYSIHGLFRYELFDLEDRLHFNMPVDLHIFDFRRDWNYHSLPLREGDCLILHMFPWVEPDELVKALNCNLPEGVGRGFSLDTETPLSRAYSLLPTLDCFTIMGIEIGGRGIPLNERALENLIQVRKITQTSNPSLRLCIDGGVNV